MEKLKIYLNPQRPEWPSLTERCTESDEAVTASVRSILDEVRCGGDEALRRIAERIDGVRLSSLEVSQEERDEASRNITPQLREALRRALENIEKFHRAQLPREVEVETSPGVRCVQRAVPVQRVGLYIPGGKAPLFSTVLMLAAPARIAGCPEVVLCTPAGRDGRVAPEIIHAAEICGVKRIFKIGGAQAVGAMAYGTESVPRVDKIFGPGNRYVTRAKQLVSVGDVAVDMPAGPSEVMVMADDSARAPFVAADLLSQAEHGGDSQALLVCRSEEFAREVEREVERQTAYLGRSAIIGEALSHSRAIVFDSGSDMVDFANAYASEHLIISMRDPWAVAARITAAGSVFIGNYSPESAGDYASGSNHTLPTSGWARAFSGVNIDSFMRKITFQELTAEGLRGLSGTIIGMAEAEGLDAHANAVKVRMEGGEL